MSSLISKIMKHVDEGMAGPDVEEMYEHAQAAVDEYIAEHPGAMVTLAMSHLPTAMTGIDKIQPHWKPSAHIEHTCNLMYIKWMFKPCSLISFLSALINFTACRLYYCRYVHADATAAKDTPVQGR